MYWKSGQKYEMTTTLRIGACCCETLTNSLDWSKTDLYFLVWFFLFAIGWFSPHWIEDNSLHRQLEKQYSGSMNNSKVSESRNKLHEVGFSKHFHREYFYTDVSKNDIFNFLHNETKTKEIKSKIGTFSYFATNIKISTFSPMSIILCSVPRV